jgi:hypothetical protein
MNTFIFDAERAQKAKRARPVTAGRTLSLKKPRKVITSVYVKSIRAQLQAFVKKVLIAASLFAFILLGSAIDPIMDALLRAWGL